MEAAVIVTPLSPADLTPQDVEQIGRLLTHLTERQISLEPALQSTLADPAVTVFVARSDDDGRIEGMLSLIRYSVPTGSRARIEDLVVEPRARGRGLGRALVEEAVRNARSTGCDVIDLTSNPSRESANRLYLRLSFQRWPTNVYRLLLRD
jgi:GNAT superfamily N-acetyltransferase